MRGQAAISRVYELGPSPVDTDAEMARWARVERLRREAWREARILAVRIDDLPETLRVQVEAWAEETYGTA